MNLNLTANIKMPDHQLRRQVIDLCNKTGKPLLKLSTKDYMDNGLGHLVEQFDGQTRTGEHRSVQRTAAHHHRMAWRQA